MSKSPLTHKLDNHETSSNAFDMPGEWWTAPAESDNGDLIMVTGRRDVNSFCENPRFNIRVNIEWKYGEKGMPDNETANLMDQVTQIMVSQFKKDPVAVLTGIYTGAGQRDWVIYTLSLNIFSRKINEMFSELPQLPITLTAYEDPQWEEYREMEQTRINID